MVDLADLGPRVLDGSDATVRADVQRLASCRALVVASPTYKGTYTGLLKAFLDRFPSLGCPGCAPSPSWSAPVRATPWQWMSISDPS